MMAKLYGIFLTAGVMVMLISGCSEQKQDEPGAVDYLTGAESMKTYKKTESKIKNINTVLEKRYQEAEQ